MARGLTTNLKNALIADAVRPVILVALEFTGGDVFLTTAPQNISWGGDTYLSSAIFRHHSQITEINETEAAGFSIVLNSLDTSMMSALLGQVSQNNKGYIYLGAFDSSWALISDPHLIAEGYFDTVEFADTGSEASATIRFENSLLQFRRIREFRYTHWSQQAFFAGDLGFEYVVAAEDWSGFWGRAARPKFIRKRRTGRR